MRQLRDDTHLILDGEVRVYRREQKPINTKIYSRPSRLTNSATALTRTHLRVCARVAQAAIQRKCRPKTQYLECLYRWKKISTEHPGY